MKKIVFILVLLLSAGIISAQEHTNDTSDKNEIKKKKKEEEDARLQKQFETNYQMLSDSSFVFKAEYVSFKTDRNNVNGNINFILVDSSFSVLQIGSNLGAGFNGVGGSTAKGNITSYRLSKNDKRKSCYLSMSVYTMAGSFSVIFDIPASGNGTAWISTIFGALTYEGVIISLKDANACIGTTWYK